MKFNFEQYLEPTHKFVFKPVSYNGNGTTYTESNNDPIASQISIREKPSANSNVLATVQGELSFIMQREWATGNNKWAFIKTQDGVEGYVMTKYTVPIDDNVSGKLLKKSNVDLKPMTQMAKLLFEATPWMENEFPKNHTENGEWWVTVTLPYTCLAEGSLNEKKNEAKVEAIQQIYEYFNVELEDGFLSTYVKDYYLGSRPGSNLMMLVVIPAVYVEYLKKNTEINVVPQEVQEEEFCISLKANSLQDLNDLQAEIKACLAGLYQKYINSTINASNFNFENEIFKQIQGIEKIKFLLKENDINLESSSNKKSGEDNCEETATNRTIKVCFDSQYQLIAVYYYNNSGEKTVLSNGFNAVKNSYPFNEPRFGLMFLKHREICSLAPSLKTFFTDYVTDPQPEVTTVTWSEKSQLPLSNLASAELQVYIDSALFLTGLAQEFGNLFDLKSLEGTLSCYGDPSQSKLVQAYKLKAAEFRDSQIMYTSDVVNIASWICNLEKPEELDDTNWEQMGEDIFGTSEGWGEWWKSLSFSDWRWPTTDPLGIIKENAEKAAEEVKEQVQNEFLRFFKTLWCELLLVAAAAATAGVGYGIYLAIKEDQNGNTAFPSPAETASFDYGSENVNDVLSESIGIQDPEQYEASLIVLFRNCGVDLQAGEKQLAREYLDGISSMLAPVEVLALLDGTASSGLSNIVSKYTQANFDIIHEHKNTSSKIAEFFACLGGNVTTEVKDKVQNKIIEKIENVDICVDICEELKNQMKEKCPDPEVYNALCEKEFTSKIDKYQEIIALISDDCSMQPKFFNNKETGEKGIFSGNKPANIDIMVEKISQTTLDPPQLAINSDSANYFTKQQYADRLFDLTYADPVASDGEEARDNFQMGYTFSGADSGFLNYLLNTDGSEIINGISINGLSVAANVELEPEPLTSEINGILTADPNYNEATSNLEFSRHRKLFYSLIQDYCKNNTKQSSSGTSPIPFIVSGELPLTKQEYDGGMFSIVFEQLLQRYARKVKFMWQGNQAKFLNAYSKALSDNSSYISGVDDAKKLVSLYYDFGDYDDPNDSESKSSLQVSLMNALLHTYFGLYIMEYFCISMPFYEIFYSYDGTVAPVDDKLRLFAEKYVTEKMNLDLKTSKQEFETIFNQSYDAIKSKQEFELPNYTGADRGIKYYLNSNLDGTYERFTEALNKSEWQKDKSYIQEDSFIYSNKKSIETHDYAGIRTLASDNQLGGENFSSIPSDRPSLFNDHTSGAGKTYNKYKNGMFFMQNYFVLEDSEFASPNLSERKDYLKGIVNYDQLKKVNDLLSSNEPSKKLGELFKSVKYGSRMCFGIAYDDKDNDSSADPRVKEFAKDLFLSYAISGPGVENNGKIPYSYLQSSEQVSQFDKSIICVDGPVPQDFEFKTDSSDSGTESEEIINSNYYPSPHGTFSVVIPVFAFEEEEDMQQFWSSYYEDIKSKLIGGEATPIYEIAKFENLNDQLINSDKMKALTESCFPLKNMIDFNAISGMQYFANVPEIVDSFSQSKQFMTQSIKTVNDGKKI